MNFSKNLRDFSEEELWNGINTWEPRFGALALYELQRRLATESDKSSKRFAKWSLIVAIVAIILSLTTSIVQITISKNCSTKTLTPQKVPVPTQQP